jgi:hypothetical protein
MLAQKGEDLGPPIGRLFRAIARPQGVEEGVTRPIIPVELIGLAGALQYRLGAVDLILVRVLVVIAEQAEERTAQSIGEVDRRRRPPSG